MNFDIDIFLFIFTFITMFFAIFYIARNYDLNILSYNNVNISNYQIYSLKYTILNNLYTNNYDTYNKFRLWLFVVEF